MVTTSSTILSYGLISVRAIDVTESNIDFMVMLQFDGG